MARIFTDGSETYSTQDSGWLVGISNRLQQLSLDEKKDVTLWPNGRVPYTISPGVRRHDDLCVRIYDAVRTSNRQLAYVNWVEKSYKDSAYVEFVKGDRTQAHVGCRGGRQEIELALDLSAVGNIIHEMGHAIGLVHEHSRLDRDSYVSVSPAAASNHNYHKDGYPIGPYDYDSIMHYPSTEGVMTCCQSERVGQRNGLSPGDIKAINFIYHPTGVCTFDHYGEVYWPQDIVECHTCWGDESNYGCCNYCAEHCHKGHDLHYKSVRANVDKNMVFVCDCGRNRHQSTVCTWHSTKRKYVKQPFYRCRDCFTGEHEGCCYQCMKNCHKGHNTYFYAVCNAFCDCGLAGSSCRTACKIPRPKGDYRVTLTEEVLCVSFERCPTITPTTSSRQLMLRRQPDYDMYYMRALYMRREMSLELFDL